MPANKLHFFFLGCIAMAVSCSKDIEPEVPVNPVPVVVPTDTTTVERMEFRWESNGTYSNIANIYYFVYDSLHRIKKSAYLDYINSNNPPQPDTSFCREYFYNGNNSLPYKYIFRSYPGRPDNFLSDTSYYLYDAAKRLVLDSGYTYNDIGYGIWGYSKRKYRFSYPAGDSIYFNSVREMVTGLLPGNSSSSAGISRSVSPNQHILKYYSTNGQLNDTYTFRYDTCKNPLAKALLQVSPFYTYFLDDGHIGLHMPFDFNRIFYQHKLPGGQVTHEYNYTITYNSQKLPIEIIAKSNNPMDVKYQIKIFY